MRAIGKLSQAVVGFAFMVLAGLAIAANTTGPAKIFDVSNVAGSGGAPFNIRITNVSPTGNSSINSIMIVPPAGVTWANLDPAARTPVYATILEDAGSTAVSTSVDASNNLKLNNFQGLLPQDKNPPHSMTISAVPVNVAGGGGIDCTKRSFGVLANAGNSWNGDPFSWYSTDGNVLPAGTTDPKINVEIRPTITASAGAGGTISPAGSTSYSCTTNATYTITPNVGYKIVDVKVDGVSQGAITTYTFTGLTTGHSIAATFAIITNTITASAVGNGSISPPGVTSVNYGANQSYTITPATGYHVDTVVVDGGSIPATSSYTFINVTAPHTISATFAIDTFKISASSGANGSVSPAGDTWVAYNGSQTYTIKPATGYHVADVLVDGVSKGAVTSYTFSGVTAPHTISATFAIDTFKISASSGANGSVTPSGDTWVDYNGSQTYTITPATGYHVADVLVDGAPKGALTSYTFSNVTGTHTISATFAIDTFTITANAGAGGSVSPAGPTTVNYGSSQDYTISPTTGYHIVDVTVDNVSQGAIGTYTFNDVKANHTIGATFAINVYTIKATSTGGGTITPAGDTSYDHGLTPSFAVAANAGYQIADVKIDGVSVTPKIAPNTDNYTYTFSPLTGPHTIEASFIGDLNCQPSPPFIFNASDGSVASSTGINVPGYAVGQRGRYNKDGSTCGAVAYKFTNKIVSERWARLWWDTTYQPGAAFLYTVTWKPQWVDPASGMPKQNTTKVAWKFDAYDLPINPVPGRACLAMNVVPVSTAESQSGAIQNYLPSVYGQLAASVGTSDTVLMVTANAADLPLSTPFPINIGSERMTVSNVTSLGGTSFQFTVTRGAGQTTVAPHDANAYVMSTPLPLDANGKQMQMCIAEESWTLVPAGGDFDYPGATDCTAGNLPTGYNSSEPLACVLFTTTIYDIGDGYISKSP